MRELRQEKGWTQEQLAEKLFVKRRTVSGWETGTNEPPLEMIVKIAIALDCDPNYLLGFGG